MDIYGEKLKLDSKDELNQINYIIQNLKINQESPEKYNYIEYKDQNTSFYSSIEVLNEENSCDNNTIIFEESNLKHILNNNVYNYYNNYKIKNEKALFIENKKAKKIKIIQIKIKKIKRIRIMFLILIHLIKIIHQIHKIKIMITKEILIKMKIKIIFNLLNIDI